MWPGWNAKISEALQYTQKIWYLPQINQSPTNHSVVAETMRRSLEITAEAHKTTIAVTYDLAIAKIVMQIQHEETPKYDSVFIALGSFHIELAFFKVLGKIIVESRGPYIIEACGICIKSFISGLSYNKCKRMHEILAAAFEALHFERFLDTQEGIEKIIDIIKLEIKNRKTNCSVYSKEEDEILDRYDKFCQEIENDVNGKTGAFWMKYINFTHIYHNFARSVRTGDFELYIACLPELTNFFFAFNHVNYARWLVKYCDALIKLPDTHAEV